MEFQYLKTPNGSLLGRIGIAPDGVQTLFRPNGTVAGFYRPAMNATYTLNGALVGTGNLLPMLLSQPCP